LKYRIEITPTALSMLKNIKDRCINKTIQERIEKLIDEPDKQGKELHGELRGYRCVRAVGQRYRIIYRIKNSAIIVLIVAVGLRKEGDKKDVYKLAQKMIHLRLIEPISKK
jgi:mRNA interferase RelE/StbE